MDKHLPLQRSVNARSVNRIISENADELTQKLLAHRAQLFPPNSKKSLRKFLPAEAAKILGIADSYLRQLAIEGKGPSPEVSETGRRSYSYQDIHELRDYLSSTGKPERYLPRRRPGEHLQVICVANFKGGSAKTTSSIHLAQYLALYGYRVLAIDLDPQASLTAMFGYQPEVDIGPNESIYGAIKYEEDRLPMREVIRNTYFPSLDLIPACAELMEFEHSTPVAMMKKEEDTVSFVSRISLALAEVQDDYDVVVIDCPPQLGFLTISALCASTALLVTVHPQMLDVMSMCQFLRMTSDLLTTIEESGVDVRYDWMRYLVTRHEPTDGPQTEMVAFMRTIFGRNMMTNTMLKSTAISDASISKQSLFEVPREQFTRATYDRAMESINLVNGEIENLIKTSWGR